jgi:predicted ATPase
MVSRLPRPALKRSQAALLLAREIDHRYTLAAALDMASWIYAYRREGEKGLELADEGIALSIVQEFPHWRAMGLMMRGLARTELGEPGGARDIREGVNAYRVTGAIIGRECSLADLAKAIGDQGKSIEGLQLLDEALSAASDTGLRHYEAEINRFRGELLLGRANETIQAEKCFRKAIAVARNQGAKSLELRATMSLARLLRDTGRRDEARAMLAGIYDWFTEGFDTADLKDAKALLDELTG